MEPWILWEDQKKRIEQHLTGRCKRIAKSVQRWEKELQRNTLWEETLHEAELLKANYCHFDENTAQLEVWDWKIEKPRLLKRLDTCSWKEWMLLLFKRARKQRASLVPIQKHLTRLQTEEQQLQKQLQVVIEADSLDALTPFLSLLAKAESPVSSSSTKSEKIAWWTYWTEKGETIWVGRNASGNEKLTFTQAHGKDIWLHVMGESGSHVVLRPISGSPVDDRSLQDAMQLALYYSKGRNRGEGEVLWTEKKEVRRPKKKAAPGRVEVRTYRSKHIRLDPELIRAIQGRQKMGDRFR